MSPNLKVDVVLKCLVSKLLWFSISWVQDLLISNPQIIKPFATVQHYFKVQFWKRFWVLIGINQIIDHCKVYLNILNYAMDWTWHLECLMMLSYGGFLYACHQKESRLFRLVLVTVFQSQATSTTKSCVVAGVLSRWRQQGGRKLFSVQIPVHDKIRIYICDANIQQLF